MSVGVQTSVCVEANIARSCFARGARCWSVPEFWVGAPPTYSLVPVLFDTKKNKGKSLPV